MAFNYNVNPVDLSAYFRGLQSYDARQANQLKMQQAEQEALQKEQEGQLVQQYLGGDASVLPQLAGLNQQAAANAININQAAQPREFDAAAIKQGIMQAVDFAKAGQTDLAAQTLQTIGQSVPEQGRGDINRMIQGLQADPQRFVTTMQGMMGGGESKVGRYKMSDNGIVFDSATGQAMVNPTLKSAIETPNLDVSQRQSINKDITTLTKDTVNIYKTAKDLEKLSSNMSGPASIAMVFKFMKALDPTSVVREGEFATAENSAGIPEAIRNTYNKLMEGGRLGEEQVKSFVSTAKSLSNSAIDSSSSEINKYLNTYEDTLPKRFKSEVLKRIPERFEVEQSAQSNAPAISPVLNIEVTPQLMQQLRSRGYTDEEIKQKLGI